MENVDCSSDTNIPNEVDRGPAPDLLAVYDEPTDQDWNPDTELEAADFFQNELGGSSSASERGAPSQQNPEMQESYGTFHTDKLCQ